MSTAPIRVVVADDHPMFRDGVVKSLSEAGGFLVVGEAGTADEAVRLCAERDADLALLDISMPGNGIAAAERIAAAGQKVRVVMLTASEANDDVMAALRAGASGFVLKGVGSAMLAEILRGVNEGESYVPPALAARLLIEIKAPQAVDADPLAALSRREEQVLRLVATGLSNKEVARQLTLEEKTVKHHMTSILGKLRVRNRTEAALLLRTQDERR